MKKENKLLEKIENTIQELGDEEKLRKLVDKALSQNIKAQKIIEEGLRKGLDKVGQKYEDGEYFLAELGYAAEMVSEAMKKIEPHLEEKRETRGKIILGTVEGDIHDIGKNIVKMLFACRGWEVKDLGVDVPPKKFVKAVKEENPTVLGMTSLLTTTTSQFEKTIKALEEKDLRENTKIIIGGRSATKKLASEIRADAYAKSAEDGVKKCEEWIK